MSWYYFLLGCTGLLCVINLLSIAGRRLNDLSAWPLPLFSFFYFLVHVITPWLKADEVFYRYQLNYTTLASTVAAAHSLIFLLVLSVAARVAFPRSIGENYTLATSINVPRRVNVLIFIPAALAMGYDLSSISNLGGLDAYQSDRIGASDSLGPFRLLATVSILSTGLAARRLSGERSLANLTVYVLMASSSAAYYYAINSRNSIFLIASFSIFMFLLAKPHRATVNRKTVSSLLVTSLAVAGAFFLIDSGTELRYSADNSYAADRLANKNRYMLDGAFGNDEASIWLEEHGYAPAAGSTYLAGLVSLVPRSLWAEKPTGGGPYLVNTMRPGAYVVGASGQSSITTGALVEAKLNFGLFGVLVFPLFWVLIVSRAVRLASRSAIRATQQCDSPYSTMALVTVVYFLSTSFVYSEFLGFFARLIVTLAPLLVIGFLAKRR